MRTAKHHPQVGWLFMEPRDYSRSLDKLLLERDCLGDPNHSGPAPAYLEWVWEQELPALAQQPRYQRQFQDRVIELDLLLANLKKQIDAGRLDLLPDADAIEAEVALLEALTAGVAA